MQITSFWAKGYRSLTDVRVDNLGRFNVFYGKNGSGKSNVLAAMRTLFELTGFVASQSQALDDLNPNLTYFAIQRGIISRRDLSSHDPTRTIVLGATLVGDGLEDSGLSVQTMTIEITLRWAIENQPTVSFSKLCFNDDNLRADNVRANPRPFFIPEPPDNSFRAFLINLFPRRIFALVGADRTPRIEVKKQAELSDGVGDHLRAGRLKNALLAAQNDPNHRVRRQLGALRQILSGPPLHRPPFDPVLDPASGEVDLRELLPEPNPEGKDVSIDLAGLGVAQIYSILAQTMLLGARAVGIEEPEAHLHAPTSGRELRQLLKRLVDERHIDQLFIATHSNLFDLDSTGYFDVSLGTSGTTIERAELSRVDREHLYEPGPAKHALVRMLEYLPPDEVIFRQPDGTPIPIADMLRHLQEDDDLAVEFLRDLHSAAMRMLKVKSKRGAATSNANNCQNLAN